MKTKALILSFALSCLLVIAGCGKSSPNSRSKAVKVYPVKIQSITTDNDGNFIAKGTTKAPKGTKLFVQTVGSDLNSDTVNQFENFTDASWVKVRENGSFKGEFQADEVIDGHESKDWQILSGDKGKVKIFAASNLPKRTDDSDIPKKVRKAVTKAKLKSITVTADAKIAKDSADSSKSDDSSSDSSKSSSSSQNSSSNDTPVDTSEDYQPISYDDLARHPKANLNKPIQISGEVSQVQHNDGDLMIFMYMDDNPDETVMVVVNKKDKPSGAVLEHDKITIKGNAGGKQSYETVLGNDREIPYVDCNEKVIDNGR